MKSKRNLTRFTYEHTAFQGWRLCLSRKGTTFTKYFSDREYGGEQGALAAAERMLLELKSLLGERKQGQTKLPVTVVRKAEKLLHH